MKSLTSTLGSLLVIVRLGHRMPPADKAEAGARLAVHVAGSRRAR